jgi:DNA-binding NtrC family response regulator
MFRQSPAGLEYTLDIVIYEEDQLTRNLLSEWLGVAGYRVRSGALREAPCNRPADLVIASVYMPKQSGSRWVRDIRAAHPGIPLIAMPAQPPEPWVCSRSSRNRWFVPTFLRRCAV